MKSTRGIGANPRLVHNAGAVPTVIGERYQGPVVTLQAFWESRFHAGDSPPLLAYAHTSSRPGRPGSVLSSYCRWAGVYYKPVGVATQYAIPQIRWHSIADAFRPAMLRLRAIATTMPCRRALPAGRLGTLDTSPYLRNGVLRFGMEESRMRYL
jgi:hypothetical protein